MTRKATSTKTADKPSAPAAEILKVPTSFAGSNFSDPNQKYVVKFDVDKTHNRYIKPLLGLENRYFLLMLLQVNSPQELDDYLAQDIEVPENESDKWLPGPSRRECTLEELMDVLGITKQVIGDKVKQGIVVKLARGQYDLMASCRNVIRELRDRQARADKTMDQRERSLRLANDKKQFELDVLNKKYVLVDEAIARVERDYADLQMNLVGMASTIAPQIRPFVKRDEDVIPIKEVIDARVREYLHNLARSAGDMRDVSPPDALGAPRTRAAGKAKPQRMVGRKPASKRKGKRNPR